MNFHTSNNEKEGVSNISQFDTPPLFFKLTILIFERKSHNTLVAIERGQGNPRIETLMAVADTLGLQVEIG